MGLRLFFGNHIKIVYYTHDTSFICPLTYTHIMNYHARFVFLFICLFQQLFLKSTVIQSPTATMGTSFDFTLSSYVLAAYSGVFYTGAENPLSENTYAIAAAGRTGNNFIPLAPKTVTFNSLENQRNPLFGAGIAQLASWGDRPLMVKSTEKDTLYFYNTVLFNQGEAKLSLIDCKDIKDASGAAAEIINVATDTERSFIFASDTQTNSKLSPKNAFIAVKPATGIALATYAEAVFIPAKDKEPEVKIDAHMTVAPTVALNGDTDAIKINGAATLKSINDLSWDPLLQRLFIALSVTSGNSSGNGARSVVLGSLVNGNLTFSASAPDTAFFGIDTLVGTGNSSTSSEVLKVRTMHTSTRLIYMILVNRTGVYALPVINTTADIRGSIASRFAVPKNNFSAEFPYQFQSRVLNQPAINPADMVTLSTISTAAKVGGTISLAGTTINKIQVSTDAVLVSSSAGVFRSQAIFNANGLIDSWTDWQLAAITPSLFGFAYDPFAASFWTVSQTSTTSTVQRSDWSDYPLQEKFPQDEGGIQTLATFTYNSYSLIAAAGKNTLTLTKTGDGSGPTQPITYTYTLPDIGAVTSIVLMKNWFVVGGSTGVAVLAGQNGAGWTGSFDQLQSFVWRKIETYTNVRTLEADNTFLYIVTDKIVDTCLLTQNSIKNNTYTINRLASVDTLASKPKTLSDFGLTDSLMFLATTTGLLVSPLIDPVWSPVTLNESPGAVSALYLTKGAAGYTLYALASSASLHQSRIYRLAVIDGKVASFEDYFIKDVPTFFVSLGNFRNYMTNNGALFEFSRSAYIHQPVVLEKLPPDFRFGVYQLGQRATPLTALPLTARTIRRLAYDPATGNMLAYGEFGIKINH